MYCGYSDRLAGFSPEFGFSCSPIRHDEECFFNTRVSACLTEWLARFDAGRRIFESSGPGARGLVVDLSYGPAPRARCAMEKK